MSVEGLFGALGTELIWQVLASGVALVVAAVAGVLGFQRRPVPPPVLAAGASVAALVVLGMGRATLYGWQSKPPEALALASTTFASVHLLGPLSAGPVVVVTLLLAAATGARAAPRQWAVAGLALGLIVATAGVVVWGGTAANNVVYAWIRAAAYLALGVLVFVALLGGGEAEDGGPDAAAAAGAVFPLIVALGEASERGLVQLLLGRQTPNVPPEKWGAAVDWMLGKVAPEWTAAWVAFALAAGVAALGAFAGRRGRKPAFGVVTAGVGVTLGAAVLWASDLGPRLLDLAALCSGQAP